MLSEVENPCSQGGRGECAEDCVDSGGRGGGHGLLLVGGLDKEGCAGAWTRGLARLGGSDGEAWGLVTSPVCVSENERREEEAAAGRRSRCALKTVGHSGWCEGGVSPGGSSGGVIAVT